MNGSLSWHSATVRLLVVFAVCAILLTGWKSYSSSRCQLISLDKVVSRTQLAQNLSCAALRQSWGFVIYSSAYREIPYPNGDVPQLLGVCTDVIVRAYRAIGVDLQRLVHERLGGDPNISHRQVRVLRQLFAKYGQVLPISQNPADYRPGDIVTYALRPIGSRRDHIAIVASSKGASNHPMIIHNRGLGVSIDDALFSEPITGHYRFLPTFALRGSGAASGAKHGDL